MKFSVFIELRYEQYPIQVRMEEETLEQRKHSASYFGKTFYYCLESDTPQRRDTFYSFRVIEQFFHLCTYP